MQQLKNLHEPINYRKVVLRLLDFYRLVYFFSCQTWFVRKFKGVCVCVCADEWAENPSSRRSAPLPPYRRLLFINSTFCGAGDVSTSLKVSRGLSGKWEKTAAFIGQLGSIPAQILVESWWISKTLQLKCFHFQQSHFRLQQHSQTLKIITHRLFFSPSSVSMCTGDSVIMTLYKSTSHNYKQPTVPPHTPVDSHSACATSVFPLPPSPPTPPPEPAHPFNYTHHTSRVCFAPPPVLCVRLY